MKEILNVFKRTSKYKKGLTIRNQNPQMEEGQTTQWAKEKG